MSDLAQRLERRYAGPGPRRRPLIIVGVALLAAAGLAWVIWAMLFHARPLVHSELVGYDIRGEHSASATFTVVRRNESVAASCLLQAQAADHSVVGELNVDVGPAGPTRVTLEKSVRTEREATLVALVGCAAPGQNQRR